MVGTRLLLHVVRDPGGDGPAGQVLASLADKEHERELRAAPADGLEELDAVHVGHLVIGDHAVESIVLEAAQPRPGVARDGDRQLRRRTLE